MHTTTTTTSSNAISSSVKNGLVSGLIFGIIGAGLDAVYIFVSSPLVIALVALTIIIAGTIFYGQAGMRTARQTSSAFFGALAGSLAGMLSFLIGYITNLIFAYNATTIMRQNSEAAANLFTSPFRSLLLQNIHIQYTDAYVIQNAVNSIGAIWIIAIIGAVLGLIAGLIGRRRAARPAQFSPIAH